MGVDITVSTRKEEYFPGDVVEGAVNLVVKSSDAEGSSAGGLVVRLFGLARTNVVVYRYYNNHSHAEPVEEKKEFLGHDVQLASFGGKAPTGTYSFPFSITLPSNLTTPSFKEEKSSGRRFSVEYGVRAQLDRPGILHRNAKDKKKFTLLSRPEDAREAMPLVVADTQKVKKAFVFKSGSVSIGLRVDRTVVGLNAPLELTVLGRNDSTTEVKALHVEIRQRSKWTAKKNPEKHSRVIASIEVSGSDLGDLQRNEARGLLRGNDVEELAREDLRQQLAAGAGTRYEILVPADAVPTRQGETFEVWHELIARLETGGMSTSSPEVSTPLLVHPGTTGAASEEEAGTEDVAVIAPMFEQAEQFSTLMEMPVVVPESAVTATYANELPPEKLAAGGFS